MTAQDVFAGRLKRAQARVADTEADAMVLFPSKNLYYLTGFMEHPSERHLLFIVTPDDHAIVAPAMYGAQLRETTYLEEVVAWDDSDDPMDAFETACAGVGLANSAGTILVDDTMHSRFLFDIQSAFPNAEFKLASSVLERMRLRKDDHERRALRQAAAVSDAVLTEVREMGEDVIGMTERELATHISRRLEANGGEGDSFAPIVGSGPNGAHPHHRHGDRVIEAGDPVVLDFGAFVDHYPGDQTRTVVFGGTPPEDFVAVHDTVLAAFHAAVDRVEPGVTAQEVDRAARAVIEEAGYGEQFLHRTGHGLGLDVHERPYIVDGNETTLQPGMVHSIEPGIYLEGEFGVRIEDAVLVTDDGCERLNDTPKTWRTGESIG